MNILVIAAHPDDEVLGCGGTIAREAIEGNEVYISILGEGVTSRYEHREKADSELISKLHNQSNQVASFLGAKEIFMYNLPDNQFDTVPLLDVVKIIEGLVDKLAPTVIYTHHCSDLNIDHTITHRATLTATRPFPGQPVKDIFAFEIPSSTEWAFGQLQGSFNPNVFVDISKTLDKKIKALEIYVEETRTFPHPRSQEALRSTAKYRGSAAGFAAAEGFEVIRSRR